MSCNVQAKNKYKRQKKKEQATQTRKRLNWLVIRLELSESQNIAFRTYLVANNGHNDQREKGLMKSEENDTMSWYYTYFFPTISIGNRD